MKNASVLLVDNPTIDDGANFYVKLFSTAKHMELIDFMRNGYPDMRPVCHYTTHNSQGG